MRGEVFHCARALVWEQLDHYVAHGGVQDGSSGEDAHLPRRVHEGHLISLGFFVEDVPGTGEVMGSDR